MSTTTIAHLTCRYQIPAEHRTPAAIRSHLDSIAHDRLATICSDWLTRLLDPHDQSVWLIRHLDVNVHLDIANTDPASQADIWGKHIVKSILHTLTSQPESDTVKHFPNRAAYIAHFVRDLAEGRAWDLWYYRSFSSLSNLPVSTAIRTVLTREPEQIATILALLAAQKRLESILHRLSDRDAHILYTNTVGVGSRPDPVHSTNPITHPYLTPSTDTAPSTNPIAHPYLTPSSDTVPHPYLTPSSESSTSVTTSSNPTNTSHTPNIAAPTPSLTAPDQNIQHPSDIESDTSNEQNTSSLPNKTDTRAKETIIADNNPTSHPPTNTNLTHPLAVAADLVSASAQPSASEPVSTSRPVSASNLTSPSNLASASDSPFTPTPFLQEHTSTTEDITTQGRQRILEILLAAWSTASLQLSEPTIATAHNALRLYTTVSEQVSRFPAAWVRQVIEHLLRSAELLRTIPQPTILISYLVADDLTSALQQLQEANMLPYLEHLSFLQQVAVSNAVLLRRIIATLATSTPLKKRSTVGPGTNDQHITTLLGSLALLLPSFIDLKFPQMLANAPYTCDEPVHTAAILRYLIFLKCFGLLHTQWSEIASDPLLLMISAVEDLPLTEISSQLSQSATAEMNRASQYALVQRLAQHRMIEGQYLYAEQVETAPGTPLLLIRDLKNDTWLFAMPIPAENTALHAALLDGLNMLHQATGRPARYLILGTGLAELPMLTEPGTTVVRNIEPSSEGMDLAVAAGLPRLPFNLSDKPSNTELCVLWTAQNSHQTRTPLPSAEDDIFLWGDELHPPVPDDQAFLTSAVSHLKPATKDLQYLTLYNHKKALIENSYLDLTLSLFARALMKAFARRLLSFEQSSLEYLYRNFLAGTSTVLVQPDLLEVHLARNPLHVVLRIAGMHEQSYAIPWLEGMQVDIAMMN